MSITLTLARANIIKAFRRRNAAPTHDFHTRLFFMHGTNYELRINKCLKLFLSDDRHTKLLSFFVL